MQLLALALSVVALLASCGTDREVLPIGTVAVQGDRIAVHGNCHSGRRLEADESADVIILRRSVDAEDGGECFDCLVVTLSTDVADREVIDGATDRPICRDGDPALHTCFDDVQPEG